MIDDAGKELEDERDICECGHERIFHLTELEGWCTERDCGCAQFTERE